LSLKNRYASQTAADGVTKSVDNAINGENNTNKRTDTAHVSKKLRRSNSLGVITAKDAPKSAHDKKAKANSIQAPFTTLNETFKVFNVLYTQSLGHRFTLLMLFFFTNNNAESSASYRLQY
jgi:hypothetical protein